jgi:hypothetical protein
VDISDFASMQCEMMSGQADCTTPSDCDSGKVCCIQLSKGITCVDPSACSGADTYVTCSTYQDCPGMAPNSCNPLDIGVDAGISLSVCTPQGP